jgi:hypothetical protein
VAPHTWTHAWCEQNLRNKSLKNPKSSIDFQDFIPLKTAFPFSKYPDRKMLAILELMYYNDTGILTPQP